MKVRGLSCLDAHELVLSKPGTLLIDVRSSMEFLFVGHPSNATHIAWIDEPNWIENEDFIQDITRLIEGKKLTKHSATLVLICRSGNRSNAAGKHLLKHGFDRIYNVTEGFEGDRDESSQRSTVGGWRYHNLPWEQC